MPAPVPQVQHEAIGRWFEAAIKVHDGKAVMMLFEVMGSHLDRRTTALHVAARHNHDLIAAQLLTEDPSMADAVDESYFDAFRLAIACGSKKVVAVMMKMVPHVIRAESEKGDTALLHAVQEGHAKIVSQLLALDPNLANAENFRGCTAVHFAAWGGREKIMDRLRAVNPQLIINVRTALHMACGSESRSKNFYAKLLAVNPAALRAKNSDCSTPFEIAVANDNEAAIEVLQQKLTFEEVVDGFECYEKSFEERLRPIVERQCACLEKSFLLRDVMGIVFEYLGFSRMSETQPKTKKRKTRK